jgi:hypothetical protein
MAAKQPKTLREALLSRLRLALQSEDGGKMSGTVEGDETFIGGKARNMSIAKKKRLGVTMGRSMAGKVAILGLVERHGKDGHSVVRLQGLDGRKKHHLQENARHAMRFALALRGILNKRLTYTALIGSELPQTC